MTFLNRFDKRTSFQYFSLFSPALSNSDVKDFLESIAEFTYSKHKILHITELAQNMTENHYLHATF